MRSWSSAKLRILRATEKSSVACVSAGASALRTIVALAAGGFWTTVVATSRMLWSNVTRYSGPRGRVCPCDDAQSTDKQTIVIDHFVPMSLKTAHRNSSP